MSDTYDPAFERHVGFFRRHERLVAIVNLRWRTAPADIKAACRERLSNPADAVFHWRPITATTVKRHCGTVLISFPDRIKRDQAITELAGLRFNRRLATVQRPSKADAAAAPAVPVTTADTPRPQGTPLPSPATPSAVFHPASAAAAWPTSLGPWFAGPPVFPAGSQWPSPWQPPLFPVWPHQFPGPWQTGAPQWSGYWQPPTPGPVSSPAPAQVDEVASMSTRETVETEAPALTPEATAAPASAASAIVTPVTTSLLGNDETSCKDDETDSDEDLIEFEQ